MIYTRVKNYISAISPGEYHPRMTRRDALIELIEKKFGGSQAEFARAINRAPAQVHHWVSGHRNIGDAGARHIEMSLGLPQGYLDNPDKYHDVVSLPVSVDIKCLAQALAGLDVLEREFGRLEDQEKRAEFLWELYRINKELLDEGKEPMSPDNVIRIGKLFAAR